MTRKTALIIGAGPAGLTAAYELLDKTDIHPVIVEATSAIGGISQTVNHHGNRIDLGGHRFFSKSNTVMTWWQNIMPPQGAPARDDRLLGRKIDLALDARHRPLRGTQWLTTEAPDPERDDNVLLIRQRLSRILFNRKFFDYPITLNRSTLTNIGLTNLCKIAGSYGMAAIHPIKPERSLEDFLINRFGRELYKTFFRDYTEKVWGVPCNAIAPEWGAQRIKGLSVANALQHAVRSLLLPQQTLQQKQVETSLINRFLYPKYGPGQLWETVAHTITQAGGEIRMNLGVVGIRCDQQRATMVELADTVSGQRITMPVDYVLSSMPVRELIAAISPAPPREVVEVAQGLCYRDFITVGLLLNRLQLRNTTHIPTINDLIPDNWVYVQEPDVRLGRIQFFNNWSPYMVADPKHVWIGLEYFCNVGDQLWRQDDRSFASFAIKELISLGIITAADVLDSLVIRVPKAYPAYFGTFNRFDTIRDYCDAITNMFLIGRNGMHRYNNMDHSMLTAMAAVDCIKAGSADKSRLWAINAEESYHEEK